MIFDDDESQTTPLHYNTNNSTIILQSFILFLHQKKPTSLVWTFFLSLIQVLSNSTYTAEYVLSEDVPVLIWPFAYVTVISVYDDVYLCFLNGL